MIILVFFGLLIYLGYANQVFALIKYVIVGTGAGTGGYFWGFSKGKKKVETDGHISDADIVE